MDSTIHVGTITLVHVTHPFTNHGIGSEQYNESDHSYGQYQDNIPPLHRNKQYVFSTFVTWNLICVQLNSIMCVFVIYM